MEHGSCLSKVGEAAERGCRQEPEAFEWGGGLKQEDLINHLLACPQRLANDSIVDHVGIAWQEPHVRFHC